MTNEKMRKRVVEVIEEWHRCQKRDMNGHTIWAKNDAENLALFLITEVIGDVESITEMWLEGLNLQFEKTEAAEYRAEVAERAVENLVRDRNYLAAQIYLGVENDGALTVDYYMRQAEKQLAKEKKK